ncbi:hypothetical protein [Amycolatopsis sp. WQ 127309]|uniref:hypothetical protein n=1 Tax=Amycolatopsis sp. WQ 127309 TaxID=2932773 RepID=UPI001FF4FE57|nr:hypothetical protein [Amycolatopsis sp. WQ 127309]UOZ05970.1 hypothetical protein MUY22_45360 [Amycolatopsis sp. WQ 127309]
MVIRVLPVVLLLALTAFGAAAVVTGIAEQHAADTAYLADFSRPGAECGAAALPGELDLYRRG